MFHLKKPFINLHLVQAFKRTTHGNGSGTLNLNLQKGKWL